ncbi:uncharacterized protein LOC125032999 [Penaeus chinensis]|uniref:uncharacterized protein LOC125032999 n=1 Tax=Penaeus chinensis TaxID=139456 RepID=UPI001FB7AEC3|nr:uncharacterized protein LOC125032999 [Penaeus chinensis]
MKLKNSGDVNVHSNAEVKKSKRLHEMVPDGAGDARRSKADREGPSGLAEEPRAFPLIPEEDEEDEAEDNLDAAEEVKVVPDGGWGWLVAFGSFIIMTLVLQLSPCFGILFSRYLLDLGASSITTAWIFNVQCFLLYVMGMIVSPLSKEFGWQSVGILGSAVTSLSIIISAFSPSPQFLFFSFSLLSGIGSGLAVCMCFIIVPVYFDRRRGIANAIMMAGICMGEIIGPPFIRYLQDEYSFKGATLILGGVILNGCVGAAFFHPVEWHMKTVSETPKESQDEEEDNASTSRSIARAYNRVTSTSSLGIRPTYSDLLSIRKVASGASLAFSKTYSGISLRGISEDQEEESGPIHPQIRRTARHRYVSECSYDSVPSYYNSTLSISSMALANHAAISAIREREKALETTESSDKKGGDTQLHRLLSSIVADVKILTYSLRAIIISIASSFYANGYLNFIMMVPFSMQASGYTLQDSTYCLSVAAICNLISRLSMSLLSDWPWFNMRLWYLGGHVVLGGAMAAFPLLPSLTWMVVVMGMLGLGIGSSMSLNTLIIINIMGLDNLAPVFGASSLTVGVGFVALGPIIGSIRDATDSYVVSMWICAGMISFSGILWFFMPAAVAYDAKRDERKDRGGDGV